MEVSLNALKHFINLDGLTPDQISHALTFAGDEVEEVRYLAQGTKLCIGEIKTCEKLEGSDHLHILNVDLGTKYGVKQIVCGAPNARVGLKVIVALEGCELPGGKITKSTIKGVESNGMCCSLLELGLDKKYLTEKQCSGIEELEPDAPIGEENVLGYLGLDDVIFSIAVLANRPDLLSVLNIARELGAIFEREVTIPETSYIEDYKTKFTVGSATSKCTQFAGKEIKGIKSGSSPVWMQRELMAMGVRSINNIVDVGNYVMLITGQPLHMYDLDKLPKKALEARDDITTDFVALDEKTYKIQKGDICICSDKKVMCLGGVMGSQYCAVDDSSRNIVIEAASFNQVSIRKTSLRLGLSSESSNRFIKGTNHFQSDFVIDYATKLIKELCGGESVSNTIRYQSEQERDIVVECKYSDINKRLGTSFSNDLIKKTLERLSFKVNDTGNDTFNCVVPRYRLDVSCWEDISEEVIRLLGYDNVGSTLPEFKASIGGMSPLQEKINEISTLLIDKGLDQCLTYTLISEADNNFAFNDFYNNDYYEVINPLTDDHKIVRTSLTHSLIKTAIYNISRQNKNLGLFEVSTVTSTEGYKHHLCVVLANDRLEQSSLTKRPYDFYDLKGLLEDIFQLLGIEGSRYKLEKNEDKVKDLHPKRGAVVSVAGKAIGYLGEVHPTTINKYDLGKNTILVMELELDDLLSLKVSETKMAPISKYPSITHDLALVVDKSVTSAELLKLIKNTGKGIVVDATIFDIYEGDKLAKNTKSVAISITYCSDTHTLEDKEVLDVEENIKHELNLKFKAVLRH